MSAKDCFRLPRVLLPRAGIDLRKWAVIACDQYSSQPEYWRAVAREVGDAPSTLHLIFPEAYLGMADTAARVESVQAAMRRYVAENLFREHDGAIYVERTIGNRIRRGLMMELDLEAYDFSDESTSPIRPTEGTMVERLAPRIEVRRGAALELPHILVLIDDPALTVIEPIASQRRDSTQLYASELMLAGGHVAGYAVDRAQGARVVASLRALAEPQAFAQRYNVATDTPVMLIAAGDGNHSLATAKAYWDSIKPPPRSLRSPPAKGALIGALERSGGANEHSLDSNHPSRFALVELENIHDPALEFSPIHRLLFGVSADLRAALAAEFGGRFSCADMPSAAALRASVVATPSSQHAIGLIGPGARFSVVTVADPQSTLSVGTFQPIIDRFVEQGGATHVDYVHGDDALERLAIDSGGIGIHLPVISKRDLFRRVVREGPMPRKSFSMGEADEKRFYMEARLIG